MQRFFLCRIRKFRHGGGPCNVVAAPVPSTSEGGRRATWDLGAPGGPLLERLDTGSTHGNGDCAGLRVRLLLAQRRRRGDARWGALAAHAGRLGAAARE